MPHKCHPTHFLNIAASFPEVLAEWRETALRSLSWCRRAGALRGPAAPSLCTWHSDRGSGAEGLCGRGQPGACSMPGPRLRMTEVKEEVPRMRFLGSQVGRRGWQTPHGQRCRQEGKARGGRGPALQEEQPLRACGGGLGWL